MPPLIPKQLVLLFKELSLSSKPYHFAVILGFALGLHRIGTGGTGHAPETEGTVIEGELGIFTDFGRLGDAELSAGNLGGQLTCRDNGLAFRQLPEHGVKVGLFDDFQVLVRSCACGTADAGGSIEEGDALCFEEGDELVETEGFVGCIDEMLLVIIEDDAENAPHVVDEVGVIELHRPPLL